MRQFSFHGPPRPHGRSKRLSNPTKRTGPLHMPLHRCGAGTQLNPTAPPVNLGQMQDRTAFEMWLRRVSPIGRSRSSHCYVRIRSYGAVGAPAVAARRPIAHVAFGVQPVSAEHKQTANTCSYVSSADHCPWLARRVSLVPDPQIRTADRSISDAPLVHLESPARLRAEPPPLSQLGLEGAGRPGSW